ncbi:1-deoxy-D-xylulose-5-phosphate reductoisomerase [Clostridium sp. BJN0001]|uniref:1-deoxy-D-xylulose-5-phosphate reductoisomerase n=1 Tax=Clostridium sp. BJN0001 TaxID=2930219 RepID=UPI001FD045CC|nr:1-deoxy-D-xylulose-5-phosphate reductoisomerase [Clostridium sp. BJN0001]
MKKISILGATGSIGEQTIDVVRKSEGTIKIIGITANTSCEKVIDIINEFDIKYVAMMDYKSSVKIKEYCQKNKKEVSVLGGIEGINKIASLDEIDMVVTSVVGMIGLVPTIKAIESKKDIALANKETLVVAGEIVMRKAKEYGVKIIPVDSEHSAVYQCLLGNDKREVKKIILTASGGPFRGKNKKDLENVSVSETVHHPNWSMGRKISVDSATMMNKGLEIIEAHWLFNCPFDDIEVVIHKQSVIHSMVMYNDGAVIAELGAQDMRLPIQYALNYCDRKKRIADTIDFYKLFDLSFEKPDFDTFKCLKLAIYAGKYGKLMPAILNGANEEAVDLFLKEKISFLDIADIVKKALDAFKTKADKEVTIENIVNIDKEVKEYVRENY